MTLPRIADMFTLANLTAGVLAIQTGQPLTAAGFIALGAAFDVMDGWVARRLNQTSPVGLQLDSLADMVTFGVAPALLFLRMMPDTWLHCAIALLIPVASAWRLAVFNIRPASPVFSGLPTPANALWYAGLALWWPELATDSPFDSIAAGMAAASLLLSLLMVSSLPFPSFKTRPRNGRDLAPWLLALLGAGIALAGQSPLMMVNAAMAGFLTGSICFYRTNRT